MRKIAFAYSILAIIVVLSSCNSEVKKERIQKIDSLGSLLNHVNEVVAGVDEAKIQSRLAEMNQMGNWFLDNVEDTLDPVSGIILGDYLRCKKFYNKAVTRLSQVNKELEYSEKQLSTLRSDVGNGLYDDSEFLIHFNSEAESTSKLIEATDELERTYVSVNAQFVKTKAPVVALKDSIQAVILSPERK